MSPSLTVGRGAAATPVERNAVRLLCRELDRRTGVAPEVVEEGSAVSILVGTPDSSPAVVALLGESGLQRLADLGAEGFVIRVCDGTTVVASAGPNGVLYGVGRLLRDGVTAEGWVLPSHDVEDAPALPVRDIYFADHMGNWYAHAEAAEVEEYLEEMALWGYNELMTCLEVKPGETFFDTVARLHVLEDHARSLGMQVATVVQSNTAFVGPPPELKATPGPIPMAYDVCPSTPGGREFLVNDKAEYLPIMQPYEVICLWPYDGGGCWCDACAPWSGTYLDLSREIAATATGESEVRVSAWFFERDKPGEDDALFAYLEQQPTWFRDIVAGAAEVRRWVEHGRQVAQPYGVILFPDIAMFDGIPWGGRGANPAPRKWKAELTDTRTMAKGGIVYSEGRYDDINKVVWAQLLWNPDADPAETVRAYGRHYLGPEVAEHVATLVLAVEEGMASLPDNERWRRGIFHPEWDVLAESLERRLPTAVSSSWRWQLIRAKTRIEATSATLNDAASTSEERDAARQLLRETYQHLHDELNRHDPARSLPTWFTAPLEEAFPFAADAPAPV